MTYANIPNDDRCECIDRVDEHPHFHGEYQCRNKATQTLWRVDMEDITGTRFCDHCADDAFASGLFTDRTEEMFDDFGMDEEFEETANA